MEKKHEINNCNRIFLIFPLSIAAQTKPKPVDPNFRADVVFLVDSSIYVRQPNFQIEKDFVKSFGKALNVEPGKSRASLITYSTNAQRVFGFNDYTSTSQFERLVDRTPYLGRNRRMDKAIEEADRVMQQARRDVPKVVVLLTAGQDVPAGKTLEEAVRPLQGRGAKIFIVAIGDQPDIASLNRAVEKPEDVFRIPSYSQLPTRVTDTATKVVKRAGK